MCQIKQPGAPLRIVVESRVRSLYFTTSLTLQQTPTNAKALQEQDEAIERIAEEVAGNLF